MLPRVSSAPMPSKVTSSHSLVLPGYAHRGPECSWQPPLTHMQCRLYRLGERGTRIFSNIRSWIASAGAALTASRFYELSGVQRSVHEPPQPKIVILINPPGVREGIDSKVRVRSKESVNAEVSNLFGELQHEVAKQLRIDSQEDVQQALAEELAESIREEFEIVGMHDEISEDDLDEDLKFEIENAISDDEGDDYHDSYHDHDDDLSEWLAAAQTKSNMDPGSLSDKEIKIWEQLRAELEEEVCKELHGECEPFVRDELREELCIVIKEELKDELEDGV